MPANNKVMNIEILSRGTLELEESEKTIKKTVVIGAGIMGRGISQLIASKGIDVILIERDQEGAKTGKEIADISKTFDIVCNLRLWLRNNRDSGVPIALVLKRISKLEVTDDGILPVNVLPRRIKPLPDERTIWQSIDR